MSTIYEKIDQAVGRYYKRQGNQNYFDDNGKGKFLLYFEENGFEADDVEEDLGEDSKAEDSSFVEMDDDFPVKGNLDDDQKIKAIHKVLQKCYANPDTAFVTVEGLTVDAEFFTITEDDLNKSEQVYTKQCPILFDMGMQNDESIVRVMAIGLKNKRPYLQYVSDLYSRDRTKDKKKNISPGQWVLHHPHLQELKQIKIPDLHKSKQPYAVTSAALNSFFHRICPKLMFNISTEIQDSLEKTAEYIAATIRFVNTLAKRKEASCPFQVDVSIGYNEVVNLMADPMKPQFSSGDDDEEEPDDDEENADDEDEDDSKSGAYYDVIGDVKKKFKSEKLLHLITKIDDSKKENVDNTTRRARMFSEQFNQFKAEQIRQKYKGKIYDEYPRRKRFCAFIDRRKKDEKKSTIDADEIIFYEPPNNCNTFPEHKENSSGYVPEWYFNSSKTSIIPNIGYNCGNGKNPMKNNILKQKEKEKLLNIACNSSAKGALLILSFHVEQIDDIKCYLFINGQMTRFFPEDILNILPEYFSKTKENVAFSKSNGANKLISQLKIPDAKFQAFAQSYSNSK